MSSDVSKRRPQPRIAIVGAGLGGIAMAVKLKRAGFSDFTVFEQSAGPGGTWYDNTYPGCAVDIPSVVYSFSFMPFDWSRTHATQPELRNYAESTIRHFGLTSHFRFSARVAGAEWDSNRCCYLVRLASGEESEYDLLVSAVGLLNVPKYPTWPGLDKFEGPVFHTSRWQHEHDLSGQRVALVGTGSSACQLAPELAKIVGRLYLFQREPGWVTAKADHLLTTSERASIAKHKLRRKLQRYSAFLRSADTIATRTAGSQRNRELMESCLAFIRSEILDPQVQDWVTPRYPVGCKRIVRDSNFYATLNLPHVELVPKAVTDVTATGIVDAAGVQREIDAIVLATGFHAQDYLSSLPVGSADGRLLSEVWTGEPKAYLGITVPSFPNFFMLYGPNTNGGGSVIAQLERQAEVVVRVARRLRRSGGGFVDTRPRSMARFADWIDRENNARWSAALAGCDSYYLSSSGRNVTQWPRSQLTYMLVTRLLPRFGLHVQRRAG